MLSFRIFSNRSLLAPASFLLFSLSSPLSGETTRVVDRSVAECMLQLEASYRSISMDPYPLVPAACPEIDFLQIDWSNLLQASDTANREGNLVILVTLDELSCLLDNLRSELSSVVKDEHVQLNWSCVQ